MTYLDIINKALSLGLEEVEVYARKNSSSTLKSFKGEIEVFDVKKIESLSIRGSYNGKMGYVTTESFKEDDLMDILNRLVQNAKNLSTTTQEFIFDGNASYQKVKEYKSDFEEVSIPQKKALLLELEKKVYAIDKRVLNVQCNYCESSIETTIVNSKGLNLSKKEEYVYLYASTVVGNDEETKSGFGIDICINFKDLNIDKIVKDSTFDALNSLGARLVDSASYPIVLSRDASSDMLQAFSSIFSGEYAYRKMSNLVGKENTKVFGDNITIVDDPFCKKALLNMSFDDEGVPCSTTEIVSCGVFNTFLHNLKTANYFKASPTGNGFNKSVSTTNMYIKEGSLSKDEIISTVQKGIYVTDVTGLHAGINTISGDFNVQSSGYMIENGKITTPVTLFVISGNYFDLMNNVELIGNDIKERFDGVASPTLKIKSLSVSGK